MKSILFTVLAAASLALTHLPAGAADKPRLPTERPATKAAEGVIRLGGVVDFTPPEGWDPAKNATTPTRAAFVSKDRQAMMAVELLPVSMKIDGSLAEGMMRKMRQNRQANKQKYEQEPTVVKDANHVVRIQERYQMKDKVADQLHLYRAVGPRFIMVTVNSLAGEEKAAEHHAIGETTSLSATYVKPTGK